MTARRQQRPPLAFCASCNARERAIVAGRCIVCGEDPEVEPATDADPCGCDCLGSPCIHGEFGRIASRCAHCGRMLTEAIR